MQNVQHDQVRVYEMNLDNFQNEDKRTFWSEFVNATPNCFNRNMAEKANNSSIYQLLVIGDTSETETNFMKKCKACQIKIPDSFVFPLNSEYIIEVVLKHTSNGYDVYNRYEDDEVFN